MTQQVVRPEHGALFDFSARAKLRVTGTDRLRFLNGQISNDVRKASAANAVYACVLNAKGRINGDVFVHVEADSFLIDADAELREPLAARLERYVIADDVQITDVSDEYALLHAIGGSVPKRVAGTSVMHADRFAMAGADFWLPREHREVVLEELRTTLPLCDAESAETFRVERGVPRWGRELSEEIIPPEATLEVSAIDYAKGCYIGQEVISRMKMSGQTNKRLCGLVTVNRGQLRSGMRLTEREAGADVGWTTSVAFSQRLGKSIALGYVKRGSNGVGTLLRAHAPEAGNADPGEPIQVAALPFL